MTLERGDLDDAIEEIAKSIDVTRECFYKAIGIAFSLEDSLATRTLRVGQLHLDQALQAARDTSPVEGEG
jgi:hypothetical protein